MALECISPPALEPVSLSELKEYLRMDAGDTSQDLTLQGLEEEAREQAETIAKKRFVQQQWRLLIDFFPGYIDQKLHGQKVSSPFVSGSNAILVGIRYAIVLPYPPIRSLDVFQYQNANGQVSSLILGSFTISAVTNNSGQAIGITTSSPHGLISGASVTIAGNPALLAVLNGQTQEVITVTGPSDFLLNGTSGTGSVIAGGGTIQGFNFQKDLDSQPARVAPVFGQMWPVARVVLNAIQLDFTVGMAMPLALSVNGATVTSTGTYQFQAADVNRPIWIPGAGSGTDLNTYISAVANPPASTATIRTAAATPVTATGLLVNVGKPGQWTKVKLAIKVAAFDSYYKRGSRKETEDRITRILYPVRDGRL